MVDLIQVPPSDLTGAAPLFQSKSVLTSESLVALQPLTQQVVGDMAGLPEMGSLGSTLETFHGRFQISGECLAVALADFSQGLGSTALDFVGLDQQTRQLFQQLQEQLPVPIMTYPGFDVIGGGSPSISPLPEEPPIPEIPDYPFEMGPGFGEFVPIEIP